MDRAYHRIYTYLVGSNTLFNKYDMRGRQSVRKKMTGRPTKYNEEIANDILNKISTSSKGLASICKKLKIDPSTVYRWIENDEVFRNKYTRAREDQADYLADEMLKIADDRAGDDTAFVGINRIHRDKLRLETRKWIASKLKPKKYGDKLDMTTDGEKINNVKVEVVKVDSPLAGSEKEVKLD